MFEQTNMSKSMARIYGRDSGARLTAKYAHPEMPVVAVAAGIFGASELIAGGLTIMQTIAAVGAVTAAVGVVTKNETLTKIGGVMALVGGIGAIADSAGMFGDGGADSLFGANASTNPADFMKNTATDPLSTAPVSQFAQDSVTGANAPGLINTDIATATAGQSFGGAMNQANAIIPQAGTQPAAVAGSAAAQGAPQQAGAVAQQTPTQAGTQIDVPVPQAAYTKTDFSLAGANKSGEITKLGSSITAPQQPSGTFGKITSWMNNNPIPAMMGMQSISGFGTALMGGDAATASVNAQTTQTQALKNQMAGGPSLAESPQWGLIQSRITNQGKK